MPEIVENEINLGRKDTKLQLLGQELSARNQTLAK